ncbi:hypothetical protein OG417_14545 [Actinoallomurus sp. NBC_01490]|jgi:hypothetical protein|uniref:hypothetical protein n=1 Tax=Actinoallomurus sp. NBC_01490 TaxID=2903557 RepID=UPI002E32BCBA|nr:hypothetical protein [Actinoallomurus sp. NBC_01490]
MGQPPDSWLALSLLGVLVVVPVLCAVLAIVKSSHGALPKAPSAGSAGVLGRVFGHDLESSDPESSGETLADRVRRLRRDGRSVEAQLLVCTETGLTQAEAQRFVSALD